MAAAQDANGTAGGGEQAGEVPRESGGLPAAAAAAASTDDGKLGAPPPPQLSPELSELTKRGSLGVPAEREKVVLRVQVRRGAAEQA